MATFFQRDNGSWQAKVRIKGRSLSKTFPTKTEAKIWATTQESEVQRGLWQDTKTAESTLFSAIVDSYVERVLPSLKGAKKDKSLCDCIKAETTSLRLTDLTTKTLSTYRDRLGKSLAAATVVKRLNLINRIMKFAQVDLGIFLPQGLTVQQIKKPKVNNLRDRRLHAGELELLLPNASRHLRPVIKFALATAMRRDELAKLRWVNIKLKDRYALLIDTKNSESRKVPLTDEALLVLKELSSGQKSENDLVFGYTSEQSITTAFKRACLRTNIQDLNFHDLRHEAISRLFESGLNIIEAAAVSGHKELRMLQRYTHLKPANIADKLNEASKKQKVAEKNNVTND
jgi:integrase